MTHRARLSAVFAALLAVPAVAGLANTPCDLLPTSNQTVVSPAKVGQALCNVCGSGAPVPGARDRFGNGLDYNDGAKHWECEVHVNNRGNGQCKRQTTCLPGGQRFDDNGVFRCRYPAVVGTAPNTPSNPRDACERSLKVSISRVKDLNGLTLTNNTVLKPGPVKLLLEGDGAANGVSASMGGGIGVSVGDAARRLGATLNSTCLPPNCQVVVLENLANAPNGLQTLTLKTPHGYASASVGLYVDPPPPAIVLGAPECDQPAKAVWAEIQLSSNTVGPGQTINSNHVLVNVPPLAAAPGQPPTPRKWTLMLYQSDLQSVSPATFSGPASGPVTFSYTARPAPPKPAAQAPPSGGGGVVRIGSDRRPATRRCVWARLTTDQGSVVVAAPVRVTP